VVSAAIDAGLAVGIAVHPCCPQCLNCVDSDKPNREIQLDYILADIGPASPSISRWSDILYVARPEPVFRKITDALSPEPNYYIKYPHILLCVYVVTSPTLCSECKNRWNLHVTITRYYRVLLWASRRVKSPMFFLDWDGSTQAVSADLGVMRMYPDQLLLRPSRSLEHVNVLLDQPDTGEPKKPLFRVPLRTRIRDRLLQMQGTRPSELAAYVGTPLTVLTQFIADRMAKEIRYYNSRVYYRQVPTTDVFRSDKGPEKED